MAEEKEVSLLEKSLSLSKNGGIYYGGARVPADERSAVLFVGLGGSGADALIRIKDQVKTRMILPSDKTGAPVADQPKNIGFLEIDTDSSVQATAYGAAHFDPFGNEFCDISVKSTPDVIQDIKKAKAAGEECWQWFDDDVNQVAGARGAGGIRQIGRMLLANNIEKVRNSVSGKIDNLITNNPHIEELLIYVFSGISGGTGAGTFLDMAYILRKIAKEKSPNVNMMGYLIMTDVNELNGGKTEALRTNGFSCLKELEYWMSTGEHQERYYQKFPKGFVLNELECPFDFCHLLDASDVGGHTFSYDKILRSVAENVFAYISGEVGGETSTSTMASMYNNIQGYITTLTASAKYPACYNYLSLGASKIEIPYTEISTLIAARVFERLDAGMFKNRPTETIFNQTVYRDLEMTEETIRSALYRNVTVDRPFLNEKNYKYADVWPNNAPYQAVNNWLALFQRSVVQQAGNLPGYLEGRLKEFIKTNLENKKTGPVYLRYFVKSEESYCLYHMLEAFRKYCLELCAQCAGKSKELKDNMQQAYAEGGNLGFGGSKSKALKHYLEAMDRWYRNEEHAFLNEKIAEVIEKIQGRLKLYYENILRPLTDILLELPSIFEKNVNYIRVNASKVDEGTDILIRPLEFEQTRKNVFDAAVLKAENEFLGSLSKNIHKWIGRDIDGVDENIATSVDISGFISNFISENFQTLLTIDMESVMNTKLKNGESLEDYIRNRVEDLLKFSYPMYKESTGLTGTVEQFAMISVPSNCPTIYKVTKEHIAAKSLSKRVMVKKSKEESRMYIIKIASGYPLYSNAFIQDMEKAYEEQMGNQSTSSGKHLKPEWRDRLASPYIQLAWKAPYVCRRTLERNDRYKKIFDTCFANGIITHGPDSLLLKQANPDVVKSVSRSSLTAPTVLGKMEQFEKIKSKLWDEDHVIKLYSCGTYMKAQNEVQGEIDNVKENVLRFPLLLNTLENEYKLAEKIETIDEELHYPKYFAMANMNHMIKTNPITGDTTYKRTDADPFPIRLTTGQEMHPDYKDYQIYQSFCEKMNQDIKEEISLQYENLKNRIEINPNALEEYVKEIRKNIQSYEKQTEKARNEMYNAGKEERPAFLEKIEFYQGSIEELKRMLPMSMADEEKKETGSSSVVEKPQQEAETYKPEPQQGTAPLRYLNPQTWQPIESPQPGQQVFDTQIKQVIIYQPEPPKTPRYLNPQTWQPIESPQPGQQVFDTQTSQMIIYQPEPPKMPRYLNPQTWRPIENPQPGQQVFDTETQQMIQYYPAQQLGMGGQNPYQQPGMGGQNPYQQPGMGGQNPYQQPGMGGQNPYQQPGMGGQNPYQQPGMGGQNPYRQPGMGSQNPYQQPGMGGQNPYQQPGVNGQNPYQQPGMPTGYPGFSSGDDGDQE